jgi:hypothetical protein
VILGLRQPEDRSAHLTEGLRWSTGENLKREDCKHKICAARARTSRIEAKGHEPIREVARFTIVLILPSPEVGIGVSAPLGGFGLCEWDDAEYAKGNRKQRPEFLFHTTNTLQQLRSG